MTSKISECTCSKYATPEISKRVITILNKNLKHGSHDMSYQTRGPATTCQPNRYHLLHIHLLRCQIISPFCTIILSSGVQRPVWYENLSGVVSCPENI